ncbi:MAG: transposase, partial [Gammaproteobacteria bacterium]
AQVVPPEHEQALVLDASFLAKSGRQTYGLDRFWNGTAGRAENGLEISALAWLDITANQAYRLSVEQTPAAVKGSDNAALDDSRLDAYLAQLRWVVERHALQRLKYVITAGYYSKVKFLDGVIKLGLQQIGKLRCDADRAHSHFPGQAANSER